WNADVRDFVVENARVRAVRHDRGEVTADEIVLAAGSWSASLARKLRMRIPLQPGKGYSLTLARPRSLPRRAAILSEARVAVSSMAGALRFGGTMELAGFDAPINPIRVRSIVEAATRYYPDFRASDFDGVSAWQGLRPCS